MLNRLVSFSPHLAKKGTKKGGIRPMNNKKELALLLVFVLLSWTMDTIPTRADNEETVIVYDTVNEELEEPDVVTYMTPQDMLTNISTDDVTSVSSMASQEDIDTEIENQRKIIAEEEARIQREKEAARIAQIESITADPNDISKVSNLTEDQYYVLTKGTWWEGHEQVLIDLEKNYSINAFYAMSVSTLESGHGTSERAYNRNNYYGAEVPTYFESLYDNTMYFGDFQNRLYVAEGLVSVWQIGPKYCPPNRNWESYVANNMTELLNKVQSTLR